MDEPPIKPIDKEIVEHIEIEVKNHLATPKEDECGYCGQFFAPDEIVIEREIHGMKWRFCTEECYRDFQDASNFKDEDLDSKDDVPPTSEDIYDQYQDEE